MKSKTKGVSPVISVLLMLGLTLSIAAIASLTVFNLGPGTQSEPLDVSLSVQDSTATVTKVANADTIRLAEAPDENITDVTAGDTLDLDDAGKETVSIVGVSDGEETLIRQVNDIDVPTAELTVTYNPPVKGATVEALDTSDDVIATTTTEQDGEAEFFVSESNIASYNIDADRATIVGNEVRPDRLHADESGIVKAGDGATTDFDFDESTSINASVDGVNTSVIYNTDSTDGSKLVTNLVELQAINGDLDASYKLANDIDVSESSPLSNRFKPIAPDANSSTVAFDGDNSFTGTFNGAGNEITGLTIDRPSDSNIAFFGRVGSSGTVEKLELDISTIGDQNVNTDVVNDNNADTFDVDVTSSSLANSAPEITSVSDSGFTLNTVISVTAEDADGGELTYKFDKNNDGTIDETETKPQGNTVTFEVSRPSVQTIEVSDGNRQTSEKVTSVPLPSIDARGGSTTTTFTDANGDIHRVHAFETAGTSSDFTVDRAVSDAEVDVLVVGGGGGGGADRAGGGGAGGVVVKRGISVSSGDDFTITVGDGGDGGVVDEAGSNGSDSTAFELTAVGGGGGGENRGSPGKDGGSGGGGFGTDISAFNSEEVGGTALQTSSADGGSGSSGGTGNSDGGTNAGTSGGGGGAKEPGDDATAEFAGDGGDGLDFSSEFGTSFGETGVFAGGGGGGVDARDADDRVGGAGGVGGGGKGDSRKASTLLSSARENGQPNTGGGGGGTGLDPEDDSGPNSGGDGGSGIVLVRYQIG